MDMLGVLAMHGAPAFATAGFALTEPTFSTGSRESAPDEVRKLDSPLSLVRHCDRAAIEQPSVRDKLLDLLVLRQVRTAS
jgi:hypothetical protein